MDLELNIEKIVTDSIKKVDKNFSINLEDSNYAYFDFIIQSLKQ